MQCLLGMRIFPSCSVCSGLMVYFCAKKKKKTWQACQQSDVTYISPSAIGRVKLGYDGPCPTGKNYILLGGASFQPMSIQKCGMYIIIYIYIS